MIAENGHVEKRPGLSYQGVVKRGGDTLGEPHGLIDDAAHQHDKNGGANKGDSQRMGALDVAPSVSDGHVEVVRELLELLELLAGDRVVDDLCLVKADAVADVDNSFQRLCVDDIVVRICEVGDVVRDTPIGYLPVDAGIVGFGALVPTVEQRA